MRFLSLVPPSVLCFAATALTAQGAPPDSLSASAVFDESSGMLLVAGDQKIGPTLGTWLWNGAWRRDTTPGPSPRDEPFLTYDPDRKRVILYGSGRRGDPPLTDTWEWTNRGWRQLASEGPPARLAGHMVYDRRRHRVVLFGGAGIESGELNDTWEFDGTTWKQVIANGDPKSPPGRALHGLAYDANRGRVVLFGGFRFGDKGPMPLGDTWEYDGTSWKQIDVTGPGERDHLWMVYSPAAKAVILHGGGSPATGMTGDTWKYDGKSWQRLGSDGPARGRHRLVYDTRANRILLFGGWTRPDSTGSQHKPSDLWQFNGVTWQQVK